MRARITSLLLVVAVLAGGLSTGAQAEPTTLADVRIPMSDGIALVGDVRLPAAGGAFPVILAMSPYGRESNDGLLTNDYLFHGYAHVNVDVRGSGKSEGTLCVFCDREQQDVYDVVEWVAAQPWSDGNVGMTGPSYLGITSLLGAAKQPPHLKAIVPVVPYADAYRDIVWHNGIWNQQFMTQWTVLQAGLGFQGGAESTRPLDRLHNFVAVNFRRAPFDGPNYWERSVYTKYDRVEVPTLLISGWFDGFSRGTVRNFQGIASEHKRLIMGPQPHTPAGPPFDPLSPYADEPGPPGAPDPVLAWFDRFLKGISNGAEDEPAVTYYDLGAYEWRTASAWPPNEASLETLYLSGERSGSSTSLNDGSLSSVPPTGEATQPDHYVYAPTMGATETASKWSNVAAGPHARLDQGPDEAQQLTYTTPELDEPLTLAGPMELRFWGETDATNTDWIVKVTDVAPDGEAMIITAGYLRASNRVVDESRSLPAEPWIVNTEAATVHPSVPIEYRIDIWPVAHEVQPGHRLRIMVASADVPNHEPLPIPARNAVHHDARHPSVLVLTID